MFNFILFKVILIFLILCQANIYFTDQHNCGGSYNVLQSNTLYQVRPEFSKSTLHYCYNTYPISYYYHCEKLLVFAESNNFTFQFQDCFTIVQSSDTFYQKALIEGWKTESFNSNFKIYPPITFKSVKVWEKNTCIGLINVCFKNTYSNQYFEIHNIEDYYNGLYLADYSQVWSNLNDANYRI
jgi:hypothetical protein